MSTAISSDIINITDPPQTLACDHNCNPTAAHSSALRKHHPTKLHKFHKFINSTFNKFQMAPPPLLLLLLLLPQTLALATAPPKLQERASTSSSISTESTQIFERSIILLGIISPETPQHYNLENFSSPILDTTTELISDPRVNYNHIKLNCYDDDQEPETFEDMYTPRSRSRSIISNSLMSCLCKNDKVDKVDKVDKISRTNSHKDLQDHQEEDLKEESKDESKQESKDESKQESKDESKDEEDVTIDFYSFADILYCETNGRERKGSCYTISAKDYIGI